MIVVINVILSLTVFTSIFPAPIGVVDNWSHFRNGQKFLKKKNYSAAENNFRYYLRHPAVHKYMIGVAHFGLGLLYQDLKRDDLAVKEYNLAIKNDVHPDVSVKDKALMNLGSIHMKRKHYEEAISVYSQAIKHNKRNGLAYYYLGLASLKVGNYEEALDASEKARKLGVPFDELSKRLKQYKKHEAKTRSRK
jgi:tetratricopeptide (TPR) repeat protein